MSDPEAELPCTPGQTAGPFFGMALDNPGENNLVGDAHPQAIRLHGTVYDGVGAAIPDALVELWQPDPVGQIPHRAGSLCRGGTTCTEFTGWGRSVTDARGHYGFTTLTPGSAIVGRPPFFAMTVFARGLLNRLFTRAYLPGGALDNDPLLARLDVAARNSLLCIAESDWGTMAYRFDIHLQGPSETVFLRYRSDQQ